ncbi:MAG: cupin domain-containing protein [Alphaproteobacteria bacterium]|nr:cupin domain-containing protein [Alphaproteobacteria bacterium]
MAKKVEMYNWRTLPTEEVRKGVTRSGFRGEQVLLVMNRLEPGMALSPHRHPFEQVLYIVDGRAHVHVDEQVFEAGPGSVIRIPPNALHYAEPIGDKTVWNLDVFSPIRADYRHLVSYQAEEFAETG